MLEADLRARLLLAYFIELNGHVHVPMNEKFEAELDKLRKREDVKDRVRRRLSSYTRSGGREAISSKV